MTRSPLEDEEGLVSIRRAHLLYVQPPQDLGGALDHEMILVFL